jgi:hypothetical protein
MALIIVITKKSVSLSQERLYSITLNLKCTNAGIDVINEDVSCEYRTGDAPQDLAVRFQKKMQDIIDKHKAEQVIYNHAQLNTMVTWLGSNIQG